MMRTTCRLLMLLLGLYSRWGTSSAALGSYNSYYMSQSPSAPAVPPSVTPYQTSSSVASLLKCAQHAAMLGSQASTVLSSHLDRMYTDQVDPLPPLYRQLSKTCPDLARLFEVSDQEIRENQCWEVAVSEGFFPLSQALLSICKESQVGGIGIDAREGSCLFALNQAASHFLKACEISGCIVTAAVTAEYFFSAGQALQAIRYIALDKSPVDTSDADLLKELHSLGQALQEFASDMQEGKLAA